MKKAISLLLVIVMTTIALAGCGKKTDKFIGTWKVDSIEIDGAKFTVSELKAMGDDSMCAAQIVIKTGGKAYDNLLSHSSIFRLLVLYFVTFCMWGFDCQPIT